MATAAPAQSPFDPRSLPRQYLLGTPLCLTTYEDFSQHCLHLARQPGTFSVDFSNAQIVTLRRHDTAFRQATSRVDFFVPDASPLLWCLNYRGARLPDRVYGPAFMRHLVSKPTPGHTHYFLGGSEECLAKLKAAFVKRNPGVEIVGGHHGYFSAAQAPAIVDEINHLSPDFLWVGLGTPKQQYWVHENRDRIRRGVIFAVGFAFDVNAGTKTDAPPWMQRCGLNWLYRTVMEPRRIGSRVLRYNSLFLYYLLRDGMTGRAFVPPDWAILES